MGVHTMRDAPITHVTEDLTMLLAATPAPPVHLPGPKVWHRDEPGLGIGAWGPSPRSGSALGVEYGRGDMGRPLDLMRGRANDLYYEGFDDALEAAQHLSAGTFTGAVALANDNFVGTQLLTVDVNSGFGAGREQAYEFESLASTAAGRRQLERTLKLTDVSTIVDGDWAATTEDSGNVRIVRTQSLIDQWRAPAATKG
jgi:hypothetical protein